MQIGPDVSPEYKMSQTDDRQTTYCTSGTTNSTVSQKLYHAEIIYEQNASKIVKKNISTVDETKLRRK